MNALLVMHDKYLKCNKCLIEKELDPKYFRRSKQNKYGFSPVCKECVRLYQKEYRLKNREIIIAKRRMHYLKIQDKVRKWDSTSKKRRRIRMSLDPEYKKKILKTNNNRHMRKYKTDIQYKLKHRLRSRLNQALRSHHKSGAVENLSCSIQDLIVWLESQFYPNPETGEVMSWENHGKTGWHIDHIIPLSSFDLTKEKDLKKACHWFNLQPLWAKENVVKNKSQPACES